MKQTPLRRRTELKRGTKGPGRTTPLKAPHSAPKRSKGISPASTGQRAKVRDQSCVVCGRDRFDAPIHPMHLWPRGRGGCDDPLCVLAGCATCHQGYDVEGLDLLRVVTTNWPQYKPEFDHATTHAGPVEVLERLANAKTQWSDFDPLRSA